MSKLKNMMYKRKTLRAIDFSWLLISFIGISFGIYELSRIKEQMNYKEEKGFKILTEYHNIQSSIYGQTMYMIIDGTSTINRRESVKWFHTINRLLEDGYMDNKWKKFLYYTRASIFKEKGYLNMNQNNVLLFDWPHDLNFKPENIEFKNEIREITDKLIHLETLIRDYEKYNPDTTPLFSLRYIYFCFFLIIFSLRIWKLFAVDYSKKNS